ncbi:methyltransferase [Microbacterium phage FuzzBuster]|uniref:DNA (cytosine-5-)-methyltransferase n=1 Tax=Microbacterium phage FuzzBuster TaxID=2590935 RepID=A0A516KV37_9CAUD|nr:methyltransferase [Microbacterium phage FuzzBuster]
MTITALDLFAGTGWGVACQRLGIEEFGVEIMPEARAVRAANGMRTLYSDVWEGLSDDAQALDALLAERPEYQATEAARLIGEGWRFDEVYDLLIASPPCQSFSMAGKGAGRKALDDVLEAIDSRAYLDAERLRTFAEKHGDDRIALVLTPLAHVARDTPTYVVFEQVPPVLPVWERCAEEMRRWGYSVWTGNLQAEMYGVPQTRKRAILIARADGKEATPPTPTHSRYYSRDPQRLDEGVLPWVSMAEALGWGMTERPFITAGNAVGRAEGVGGSGAKAAILREQDRGAWLTTGNNSAIIPPGQERDELMAEGRWREAHKPQERSVESPAPTLDAKVGGAWKIHDLDGKLVSPQSVAGEGRAERAIDEPSVTVTGNFDRARLERGDAEQVRTGMGKGMIERHGERHGRDVLDPAFTVLGGDGGNSQPGFGVAMRSNYSAAGAPGQSAEERGRTMRDASGPSLTMTGKPGHWVPGESARPAPTVTRGGAATGGAEVFGRRGREIIDKMAEEWQEERPATTIAGDSRVWPPGHKINADDERRLGKEARERYGDRAGTKASRVSVEEAAALQSYPADFVWEAEIRDPKTGRMKPITKTNKFLQVGNAVPPKLAEAILRELLT